MMLFCVLFMGRPLYIERDVFGSLWMRLLLQLCMPLFSVKWIIAVARC